LVIETEDPSCDATRVSCLTAFLVFSSAGKTSSPIGAADARRSSANTPTSSIRYVPNERPKPGCGKCHERAVSARPSLISDADAAFGNLTRFARIPSVAHRRVGLCRSQNCCCYRSIALRKVRQNVATRYRPTPTTDPRS